jgi:methylated-DNA-[protein]-cysteine S-methyltransferase
MSPLAPLHTASVVVPGGRVVVVIDPVDGAVVASGFADLSRVLGFLSAAEAERGHEEVDPRDESVVHVVDALSAYARGDLGALDHVVVRQPGGPFVQRAWLEMRGVKAGEMETYAGLAERAGSPKAVRAAGQACARNRVAPFVPCHRILRSDGSLGGYAYGVPVKEALLVHEGALLV